MENTALNKTIKELKIQTNDNTESYFKSKRRALRKKLDINMNYRDMDDKENKEIKINSPITEEQPTEMSIEDQETLENEDQKVTENEQQSDLFNEQNLDHNNDLYDKNITCFLQDKQGNLYSLTDHFIADILTEMINDGIDMTSNKIILAKTANIKDEETRTNYNIIKQIELRKAPFLTKH